MNRLYVCACTLAGFVLFGFLLAHVVEDSDAVDIPEHLEGPEIDDYLNERLAERYGEDFLVDCGYEFLHSLPVGYRMLTMTQIAEEEVSNGGFSQFFWNKFDHYQLLTDDAIDGYETIGASDRAEALRSVRGKFEKAKAECQRLKLQEATDLREGRTDPQELNRLMLADPEKFMQVQAMQPFSKWTEFSENLWEKEESLFFHGSGIETIRGRWARAHVEAFDLGSK